MKEKIIEILKNHESKKMDATGGSIYRTKFNEVADEILALFDNGEDCEKFIPNEIVKDYAELGQKVYDIFQGMKGISMNTKQI